MLSEARQIVELQVGRARRRLFLQTLLQTCAAAWAIALALSIGWLLAEPYSVTAPAEWLRWSVAGGLMLVATIAGVWLTMRRTPSKTAAALSIDQLFGLRERVVTSFALSPEEANTSAGQALLADVKDRVAKIKVSEKFPVRLPWVSALVPAGAAALALVALFYHPVFPDAQGTAAENLPIAPEAKKEINKKLEELVKKPKTPEKAADRPKSEDLKRLEAKLDEIAKQPRDTTKQLRDRIKDMTPLEEEMKKLERDRNEKQQAMKQALQQKDQMNPNDVPKEGPAKDLQNALAEGDMEQAKKEIDKLAKKLEENKLSEKEKNDLAKQLDDLSKKMDRLSQQKDKEEQLKKLHQEGKLDAEALQRELEQLKKDNEKLKDMQKLAQKLGQCQKSLKAGDSGQAAKSLGDAAQQLAEMDLDSQELEDIKDQLQRLQSAKNSMCKACDSESECNGLCQCQGDGKCQGNKRGNGKSNSDFAQGGGTAGGARRPDGQQGKVNTFDAKQASQFNPKGQKIFDGYAPGQAFKKKPGVELAGEIQQAAQEAPDAIETQRIPKAARDMAKGYFKNLGGQQEGAAKAADKKPGEKKDDE
jgi:hypothetical protein